MPGKTDWGKHGVIAAWVLGVPTLAVAIITYIKPPDPAHPMAFDFLSKAIPIPPWLVIMAPLASIIGTAVIVRWRTKKSAPVPLPTIASSTSVKLDMHPTSLDPRVTSPQQNVNYTAKLRLSFENKGNQVVRVLPPRWLTAGINVSVQCGASPYDGVPYNAGMLDFGHRYQLEEYAGSWKLDKWKRLPNGDHDEVKEINVDPGWTFRIWIGLNPCVPQNFLEARRKTHQLGTLILPLIIGGQNCEWVGEV
jgi:hypothetical protein